MRDRVPGAFAWAPMHPHAKGAVLQRRENSTGGKCGPGFEDPTRPPARGFIAFTVNDGSAALPGLHVAEVRLARQILIRMLDGVGKFHADPSPTAEEDVRSSTVACQISVFLPGETARQRACCCFEPTRPAQPGFA